jgi:hypothetical protein
MEKSAAHLKLDDRELSAVKKIAKAEARTISSMLRVLVREALTVRKAL